MCICSSVLSIPAACEPRTDPQRACSICHPNWPVLTPPPPRPPLYTSPCCNATRALIYVTIKRSLHAGRGIIGSGGVGVGEPTVMFADFIQCFSFKGVAVVSNDSRGAKVASATGRVHVALQRACEWAKENRLACSSRTVQCPHTALHSNGGMGPNLNKKPEKKKRKKETQRWPRRVETNCAVFVAAWNAWGRNGSLTGWKSILCETPQWLRGLENVAREYSDILAQPSVAFETLCRANTHDWESLAGTAVPSSTPHGIHKVTAVPGVHQLIHSLKCRPHSSALLVWRSCLLCRRGNCLNWTSSGPTGIVLPNKGLPLPSNKCCEAHAGNVKPVPGGA